MPPSRKYGDDFDLQQRVVLHLVHLHMQNLGVPRKSEQAELQIQHRNTVLVGHPTASADKHRRYGRSPAGPRRPPRKGTPREAPSECTEGGACRTSPGIFDPCPSHTQWLPRRILCRKAFRLVRKRRAGRRPKLRSSAALRHTVARSR
jgi:hypothetical protein